MNEIARNNPRDDLTNRSFNNQDGSRMPSKKDEGKKKKKEKGK